MEDQRLVSVIVAVYNQEPYVGKCLRSICSQTYQNLQIVVVNDGSTDGSLRIINKYSDVDNRIVVISKENEGLAFARRDGLKVAEGEYVVFVDSDDYLLLTAIEDLVELSENYQVDSVIGNNYRKIGPILKRTRYMPELPTNRVLQGKELMEEYYISFFGKNILPVSVWGRIYRKSVIDKAMSNDILYHKKFCRFGEDIFFNVMLFPYLKSIYILDKPICIYRYGGMTCKYNENFKALLDFSDVRIKLLDKYNYEKGYSYLYIEYKNMLYTELLQRIQYLHHDKETLIEYIKSELDNRLIVKEMKEYYKYTCPDDLRPFIEHDYENIYMFAKHLADSNKSVFMFRKVLSYVTNFMKLF